MSTARSGAASEPSPSKGRGEKRFAKRARSRLLVRFGTSAADRTAFTKNISETGICIHTNHVHRPGTTVQLRVEFPDRDFTFWGKVVWARQVPPQLAHLLDCGMGIRFMDPGAEWLEYYHAWRGRPKS